MVMARSAVTRGFAILEVDFVLSQSDFVVVISISMPKASAVSAISRRRSSVRSPGWESKYPAKSMGVGRPAVFTFFHYEELKFRCTDVCVASLGSFLYGAFKNVSWVSFKTFVLRRVNIAD